MNAEPTINCPKCQAPIKLTESLAAPLIEATRAACEKQLADKDVEVARKQAALKQQADDLAKAQVALDEQVAARLEAERKKFITEESHRLKLANNLQLEQQAQALAELEGIIKSKDAKLAEAQAAHAEIARQQRALEDQKRELDLTIEKRVASELAAIRERAKKEAHDELHLAIAERDLKLSQMQRQIEDLKHKAEQGSEQLQGEVLELELESLLGGKFPVDSFLPVPKGEHGGDILQRVNGPYGQCCGTILWESKRTKRWNDEWLVKLRDDQRCAKAELAVIVSLALPRECDTFSCVDGVWIAHPRCAYPVGFALRQTLIEVAAARQAGEGQKTKMELIYEYLTGPRFRLRIEALIEVFSTMSEDLEKERRSILKQWDKRRTQIDRVMQATVGMYGDLQGIAGKSLQEIDGLEFKALEAQ